MRWFQLSERSSLVAGVDNLRAVVERGTADYASVSDLTLKVGIMAA